MDVFKWHFHVKRALLLAIGNGTAFHDAREVIPPGGLGHAERFEDPFPAELCERLSAHAGNDDRAEIVSGIAV